MNLVAICACGARYQAPAALSGKQLRCKRCGNVFRIGNAAEADPLGAPLADPLGATPDDPLGIGVVGSAFQYSSNLPVQGVQHPSGQAQARASSRSSKQLFLWGIRSHWVAQALLMAVVLMQVVTVVGLLLILAHAATTEAAESSWRGSLIRWSRWMDQWSSLASILAVILDLVGTVMCLALRRSLAVTMLLVGSLICKLAVPLTLIFGSTQHPVLLFLAPVAAIWLAWVLFCVALQQLAARLGRDEVAQEGTPVLMFGTAVLLGIAAALGGVVYLFSRNQEAAVLLACVAAAAYVVATLAFCMRYMNFLDAVARIERAAI